MSDTTRYHISNLGDYGRGITTDLNGYVHLTAEGWMVAPMDWGSDDDGSDEFAEHKRERCVELAAEARAATAAAEADLAEWQASN